MSGINAKSKKVRKVKAPKDPNAPKRAKSGYILFCAAVRDEVKSENPEVKPSEIMKLLGARWKALSDGEKAPYNREAEADKKRYSAEISNYSPSAEFVKKSKAAAKKSGTSKKATKDPNAPKRAASAYIIFGQHKRQEVKDAHPEFKSPDIMREIGRLWKELTDEEKQPYNKLASDAKSAYVSKKSAYDAKKAAEPVESSEEEEESSEEDESSDDDDSSDEDSDSNSE